MVPDSVLIHLNDRFQSKFQQNVLLSNLTTARVGGPADVVITIENNLELSELVRYLWKNQVTFLILGSGSNILFKDSGFEGVIILNRAKKIQIKSNGIQPEIWAESGANLGMLARKAALAGISGLEWAATVPGTVGGAVYGNAGAYDGDINGNLRLAEILQPDSNIYFLTSQEMQFDYRSSILKRSSEKAVILSASFDGRYANPGSIQNQMEQYQEKRRNSQPPGASMGSMFKNPPGDYAGRLIESAGLKGTTVGGVSVSRVHANFFVNEDQATANDIWQLIQMVQAKVYDQFKIQLELEVEPIGFITQTSDQTNAERESN
jgi:UDP-N-acetylmuramate dehydrogenase